MDVYGREPTSEAGEYFRATIHDWHPLADLCNALAPEICAPCKHWHSNDGDGLGKAGAGALATVLEQAIKAGSIQRALAVARFNHDAPGAPANRMTRILAEAFGAAMDTGTEQLPAEKVIEFAAFLRASGGFNIH
jgi:hypothetical protein